MKAEDKVEILKKALYHIKDHMDIATNGKPELSSVWHIANIALYEAGCRQLTDNQVKENNHG